MNSILTTLGQFVSLYERHLKLPVSLLLGWMKYKGDDIGSCDVTVMLVFEFYDCLF